MGVILWTVWFSVGIILMLLPEAQGIICRLCLSVAASKNV